MDFKERFDNFCLYFLNCQTVLSPLASGTFRSKGQAPCSSAPVSILDFGERAVPLTVSLRRSLWLPAHRSGRIQIRDGIREGSN